MGQNIVKRKWFPLGLGWAWAIGMTYSVFVVAVRHIEVDLLYFEVEIWDLRLSVWLSEGMDERYEWESDSTKRGRSKFIVLAELPVVSMIHPVPLLDSLEAGKLHVENLSSSKVCHRINTSNSILRHPNLPSTFNGVQQSIAVFAWLAIAGEHKAMKTSSAHETRHGKAIGPGPGWKRQIWIWDDMLFVGG